MPDRQNFGQCTLVCWGIGAILGLLTVVAALLLGKLGLIWALLLGLLVTAIVGWLLTMMLCKTTDAPAAYVAPTAAAATAAHAVRPDAATAHSHTAATDDSADAAIEVTEVDPHAGSETRAYETGTVGLTRADDDMDGDMRVAPAAEAPAPAQPDAAKADAAADAGTEDTSSEVDEDHKDDTDAADDSAAASDIATDDTDSAQPTGPGSRPEALSAPRNGAADNLKEIKGVGPKLEQLLHSLGFYHFDQIAGWTVDEVSWVDQNLKGFKGRVSRDNWVDQAKTLAAGGETEFSKKVTKGGVY